VSRTLPGAITTALAATGAQPSLSVVVQNLSTQFQLLASDATTGRTTALTTSAGTIIRAVVSIAGDPATLTIQRITSPTTAAQWTAARTTIATTARGSAGCALAQAGATIRCFYYNHAASTIVYRDSTDDGVTWGAETSTHASPWAAGNLCHGIAATSITNVFVTSALYAGFDLAAAIIYQTTFSGGSWGAWANVGPAAPPWGQLRGLCNAGGQIFAGVQSRTLKTGCSLSSSWAGPPWHDWTTILAMDNKNLGLTYAYPFAAWDGNQYTLAAMLQDDGTASGTVQTRTGVFQGGVDLQFHLVGTIGNTLSTNACAFLIGSTIYVFDAGHVYQGIPTPSSIDVSGDVLSLHITELPNAPQAISLVLANDQGQYTGVQSLTPNATVSIALGYNGTTLATHVAYIDSLTLAASPENLTCEISGRSISKFLEQVIARALIYSNQTIAQLVTAIFKATGLALDTLPTTSQFSQVLPCFMLQPGDTWATALNRLGNVYGYTTLDRCTPSVTIVEPQASDASQWSYTTDTFGLAWAQHADQSTLIRVIGQSATTTPAFADLTDDTAILLSGGERYRHIVDRNLTTAAQARIRAQRALRMEQEAASSGVLTVSLNPQHELMDVVTVTDSRVGLTAQTMRIHGIDWHIDMGSGEWLQHLHVQLP
jgi:hypothetical protein